MTDSYVASEPAGEVSCEQAVLVTREVRIHCRIHVEFSCGNVNDYGECWNLGSHGMYLAYEGEVAKGERIEVSFVLSDEYPSLIEAAGRVAWTNTGRNHTVKGMPPGFGVDFQQMSDRCRTFIQKFIQGN